MSAGAATAQQLPGVLRSLEPTLNSYGYLAIAGLVLLEDFGVPVPGETVLVLGAVYAGTGRLSLPLVALLAFAAAVAGDNIGYAIGRFGARRAVDRYGRYVFLTPQRMDTATKTFERHGGKIIIIARFIEGLRQANGIIAGTAGIRWPRFLLFNAIGAALWVAVWCTIGYAFGSHIDAVYSALTGVELYLAIGLVVVVVAFVAHRIRRRRRRPQPSAPTADG